MLIKQLERYKRIFGKDLGIQELLMIKDIRAKALIAEALNDIPEFLIDQVVKMRNDHGTDTVVDCLNNIAEVLEWNFEGEFRRE